MVRRVLLAAAAAVACAAAVVNAIPNPPVMIRGVSLGNWFILEKAFGDEAFQGSSQVDEWGLCQELGYQTCQSRLQNHWDTWVTYQDLQNIKNAGLNSVRIPIGYWAVEQQPNEPYVSGQIPVLVKVLGWLKQVGLTAQIDLHSVPGGQSDQANTGRKQSREHWTDADPGHGITIRILGKLVDAIAPYLQSRGGPVISVEPVNEPDRDTNNIPTQYLMDYYGSAYQTIQQHTNNDGQVEFVFHDQFDINKWSGFMPSSQNFWNTYLDTHQYYAFEQPPVSDNWAALALLCSRTVPQIASISGQRWMIVGEWATTTGHDWDANFLKQFAETQISIWENPPNGGGGNGGWYYWTFKTQWGGQNTWDYQSLYSQGIIPNMNNGVPQNHCGSFWESERGQHYKHLMANPTISAEAVAFNQQLHANTTSGRPHNMGRGRKHHHVHHALRKTTSHKP